MDTHTGWEEQRESSSQEVHPAVLEEEGLLIMLPMLTTLTTEEVEEVEEVTMNTPLIITIVVVLQVTMTTMGAMAITHIGGMSRDTPCTVALLIYHHPCIVMGAAAAEVAPTPMGVIWNLPMHSLHQVQVCISSFFLFSTYVELTYLFYETMYLDPNVGGRGTGYINYLDEDFPALGAKVPARK